MRGIVIVFVFLIYACGGKQLKKELVSEDETIKDTIVIKDTTPQVETVVKEQKEVAPNKLIITDSKSIYISQLTKIAEGKDYYLPVSFKPLVSDIKQEDFHNNYTDYISDLILKNIEYTRYKIEDSVANKYFEISNLNSILVFDENQNILDTLHLKNYEYFSDQLESQVIATYKATEKVKEDKEYVCMTVNDYVKKNNYRFTKDSIYLKATLKENRFKPTDVYAHYKMIKAKDTISFLSFGQYKGETAKHAFYLFRNKEPLDSIINKNLISKIISVPITLNEENIFVTHQFIPDTDAFWMSVIGIDIVANTLTQYERNRVFLR